MKKTGAFSIGEFRHFCLVDDGYARHFPFSDNPYLECQLECKASEAKEKKIFQDRIQAVKNETDKLLKVGFIREV